MVENSAVKMTRNQRVVGFQPFAGLVLATCLSALSVGCGCSDDTASKKAPAKATEAPKPEALPVDAALLATMTQATTECEKKKGRIRITCSGQQTQALRSAFATESQDRIAALPTFVDALRSDNLQLKQLAASVLYSSFRTTLGKSAKPGAVTPALADALLETTLALPPELGMQTMPATTHACILAGQSEKLWEAVTSKVSTQVRTMAYRYGMVYGRLDAFEKVRKYGGDASTAVVLAVIEAPRNMQNWSTAEQQTLCPWAAGFLQDGRQPVVGNVMAALSNCSGTELDALLAAIDTSLDGEVFTFIHATALRGVCGPQRKTRESGASDEQCERVRELLARASDTEKLEDRVRAMCLSALSYSWPDDQTLALAKKLSSASGPALQRTATEAATRLGR